MLKELFMEKLYTVKELCGILKLSKSYVYKLAERKQIGFFKIGTALRFNETHIQNYLEKCYSSFIPYI
jgi:excisionase family DNA binding protein